MGERKLIFVPVYIGVVILEPVRSEDNIVIADVHNVEFRALIMGAAEVVLDV